MQQGPPPFGPSPYPPFPSPGAPYANYPPPFAPQTTLSPQTAEHLKLLSIFHYVYAGLLLMGGLFFSIYVVLGIAMIADRHSDPDPTALATGGGVMIAFGIGVMTLIAIKGALLILAGNSLRAHRRHTLCMIVAGLSCFNIPLGTILGVFTIVVLARPEVRASFH